MERIDSFLTAITVAAAATLATAAHAGADALGLPLGAQLAIDAVLVTVALTFLQELFATMLVEASWLRRLLLGRKYVEGTWIDVVSYPDHDQQIGIVYIGSHKSGLTYHGENLDLEGRFVNSFRAESVKVDFPHILFHYREDVGRGVPFLAGVGGITFDRRTGRPARYTGYCLDAVEKVSYTVIGRRVDDADEIARLEDHETRVETALALATPLLGQSGSNAGTGGFPLMKLLRRWASADQRRGPASQACDFPQPGPPLQ